MALHRIYAIILRHTYDMRRNFDRAFDVIYWPLLDVIVWGFVTVYLTRAGAVGPTVVNFLLGAVILWGVFYAFQRDVALGFLTELWSRNLLNLFSSPLTVREYLTGLMALNVIKVLFASLAASLLAFFFYSFNVFPYLLTFIPYFLNLMLFGLALGIVITALIFRYTTKIQTLAWSLAGLLQPVSCVFYPLTSLPPFLQSVARLLPTTYAFEGMRAVLAGHGFSAEHFWLGFVLNVIYLTASVAFFVKIFAIVRKKGLLVKIEQ
jgi:ABC-2 type transport system permease protein